LFVIHLVRDDQNKHHYIRFFFYKRAWPVPVFTPDAFPTDEADCERGGRTWVPFFSLYSLRISSLCCV